MTPKKLRGAVVGTGYFSHFHFDAWSRMDDVEIAACCDLDEAKAQAVADQYGIPHAYTDVRVLLDHEQLDFVDVVTRPESHLSLCQLVAERGLALICQKPLAPTAEQARQIVQLAAEAKVPFMVHENFRFQPWYREIKRLLERWTIGTKLHTISFRNRAGDGWGHDAYLARQPYFRTMERFLIFEAGIHTIDTFRFLLPCRQTLRQPLMKCRRTGTSERHLAEPHFLLLCEMMVYIRWSSRVYALQWHGPRDSAR
jgi:predicted dehydrogenase